MCDRKTKVRGYCRACRSAYNKKWYLKNRDIQLERVTANNKRYGELTRALVHERKSQPCADCGAAYPYYVMDFDHRDGEEKVEDVSTLLGMKRTVRIIAEEMAKCDVVCANCHARREHARRYEA